jgi:phosphoglycerate dehydrogenase-like enzyme
MTKGLKPILLISKQAVQNSSVLETLNMHFKVVEINPKTWTNTVLTSQVKYLWIHFDQNLNESILNQLPDCELVLTTTTGLTHISEEAKNLLGDRLISLTRFRAELLKVTSTAELALSFLFHSQIDLHAIFNEVRNGIWSRESHLRQKQISSLRVGVVGLGRLGAIVSKTVAGLGAQVYFCEIDSDKVIEGVNQGYIHIETIDELCEISDVVSIHASVEDGRKPIMTSELFKKVKSNFVLINTSRSSLVEENALIDAMRSGIITEYYADVLGTEDENKALQDSAIWKESQSNNRIKLSPHIGGATIEAMDFCENLLLNELLTHIDR